MKCAEVERFIDAYVDGEFAASDRAEVERHLESCDRCRAEARRQSVWKSVLRARIDRPVVPYGLHFRIQRALDAEQGAEKPWRRLFSRVAPAVLVAGALAALILRAQPDLPLVQESIVDHERDWPVEVVGPDPDGVARWYRDKLDFPVRPLQLGRRVELLGGRIGHLGESHAAHLVYVTPNGRKVSVYVFDPKSMPLESHARRVTVQNRPVYVVPQQGYNVAMFRDRGMGYVVTSDLDVPAIIQLVGTSLQR